jgi:tetratricopeptide (TPR) repeat protein
MNRFKALSIGSLILFLCIAQVSAKDLQVLYRTANLHYTQQEYVKAAEVYEEILAEGVESSEVYFNLGNAYFKSGELGRSILYYERARKLDPDDEDINFNLKLAYRETIDKIESLPMVFYEEWWKNFVENYPLNRRAVVLLSLVWLFSISSGVYVLVKRPAYKKFTFILSLLFLFSASATALVMWKQLRSYDQNRSAIILNPSVYVKSSPDEDASNAFMLHEGTRIELIDSLSEWSKIRIANGNVGWMRTESFEQI